MCMNRTEFMLKYSRYYFMNKMVSFSGTHQNVWQDLYLSQTGMIHKALAVFYESHGATIGFQDRLLIFLAT